MLGYTGVKWQSQAAPLTPPRPAIDTLLSGYRRIPVAQIDADIFCDTRIIADEIALLSGTTSLSPYGLNEQDFIFSEFIENDMFIAALNKIRVSGLVPYLFKNIPLTQLPNYIKDKKHIYRHSNPDLLASRLTRKQYQLNWHAHLDDLENRLKKMNMSLAIHRAMSTFVPCIHFGI